MHQESPLAEIETLKRWKTEGKIELVEAAAPRGTPREPTYGWPGATQNVPPGNRGKRRGYLKKEPAGGVNFNSVAAVLFPGRNAQKLSMSEINDIAHLVKHHGSKNEIFVTANSRDFIDGGKRDRLKASFGILAMAPIEVVEMLSSIEGWK